MAQNFLTCDRDQPLLLPPDMREWLPEDHLAWFVMEAVEELDLDPFYAAYRADGRGRAAHEPEMMVALLSYAYAIGERSSRKIETRCREDVAFRVIARAGSPTTRRSPPPAIARGVGEQPSPRRSRAAARQPAAGVARPAPQRSWPDLGAVGSLRMMAQKLPHQLPHRVPVRQRSPRLGRVRRCELGSRSWRRR
jgi:hypothetical protein